MFESLKSAPLIAKLGLGFATFIVSGAVLFGTVSDSDIHRKNGTLEASAFFNPAPGAFFEVIDGRADYICGFDNASEGLDRQQRRDEVYYNALGQNIPVAPLVGLLLAKDDFNMQVTLSRSVYAEGLRHKFHGEITADCEEKAQVAYRRNSVVCIVHSVLRSPDTDSFVAVRFKQFAFTPEGVESYPRCPLKQSADVFWNIRRTFISVGQIEDDGTEMAVGTSSQAS
ncbi:MAG: hypothetical protein AB8B85_00805 [Paracoccaceae bacterium]